ncbi:MAG: hypothetical protein ABIQ18_18480 [Umezawaea sp.]
MLAVTPAVAQGPSVSAKPNEGAPGDGFTVSWSNLIPGDGCTNPAVAIRWDNQQQIGTGTSSGRAFSGSANVAVPKDASAGGHTVVAAPACVGTIARTPFTVTVFVPPTTTTTTPPVVTTTTTPPVVTNPTTTTTKPPVIVTTTTTAAVTTTTTTTDTSSSSSSAPSSSGIPTTLALNADGSLTLDKDNIQPGDLLNASGVGCAPGSDVRLTSKDEKVGTAKADSSGKFTSPVEFDTVEPGRHVIEAQCDILLVGNVDVSLTSGTSGTSSTLVVLVFFVLVGATMLRRQFSALRLPVKN